MKRTLIVCLTLFLTAQVFSEVGLETLVRVNTDAYVDTNRDFFVDKGGAFYVSRAYLTLKGDAGKAFLGSIKTRLTIDFAKPSTPIKYAYLDWKFYDFLVFTVGLMKSEFGYLTYWEYPIPVKYISDMKKEIKFPSADFGVGISGRLFPIEGLTSGLFYYNIQVLNGEGYDQLFREDTTPPNDSYASHYTFVVSPISGIKLGGTYRLNPYQYSTNRTQTTTSAAYSMYIAANNIEISDVKIPLDFILEYLNLSTTTKTPSKEITVTGYAFTTSIGYTLFDLITPYLRFDLIEPNTADNQTNDVDQIIYVGMNVKTGAKSNMVIKPLFYYYLMKGNNTSANDWGVKLEFEYKIGFSIWQ